MFLEVADPSLDRAQDKAHRRARQNFLIPSRRHRADKLFVADPAPSKLPATLETTY